MNIARTHKIATMLDGSLKNPFSLSANVEGCCIAGLVVVCDWNNMPVVALMDSVSKNVVVDFDPVDLDNVCAS